MEIPYLHSKASVSILWEKHLFLLCCGSPSKYYTSILVCFIKLCSPPEQVTTWIKFSYAQVVLVLIVNLSLSLCSNRNFFQIFVFLFYIRWICIFKKLFIFSSPLSISRFCTIVLYASLFLELWVDINGSMSCGVSFCFTEYFDAYFLGRLIPSSISEGGFCLSVSVVLRSWRWTSQIFPSDNIVQIFFAK